MHQRTEDKLLSRKKGMGLKGGSPSETAEHDGMDASWNADDEGTQNNSSSTAGSKEQLNERKRDKDHRERRVRGMALQGCITSRVPGSSMLRNAGRGSVCLAGSPSCGRRAHLLPPG